jgi:thymidylate synthase (FAD)
MKLIKPIFEILDQGIGLEGVYKQIERVGRTCYKSEDKIAEGTAKPFVDRMIASKHLAMCEHGTIYLSIPIRLGTQPIIERYLNNCYSKVAKCCVDNHHYYCVTTNLRVLVENNWMDNLCYLCEPTEYHTKRIAVKFTLDQGVMREFTRHRVFSFACESTRYCNYSKGKFNEEITFIEPCWEMSTLERDIFISNLTDAESHYMALLNAGWKPQQARNVLPLATKCDLVMTGFVDDWDHFCDLRARGTTGAPHPQAKELAEPLLTEFIRRNYIHL